MDRFKKHAVEAAFKKSHCKPEKRKKRGVWKERREKKSSFLSGRKKYIPASGRGKRNRGRRPRNRGQGKEEEEDP